MSDKKERTFERVNTSGIPDDWDKAKQKEPGVPVTIPMNIVRWVAYSTCFALILAPGFWLINYRGVLGVSYIFGWFASQLNALINKK